MRFERNKRNATFHFRSSTLDLVGDAAIESDRKPSCVNVIIKEPNMGIRITSGYLRGFHLSKIIQLYTKFDSRLLKLMRLFRYFAKVCCVENLNDRRIFLLI